MEMLHAIKCDKKEYLDGVEQVLTDLESEHAAAYDSVAAEGNDAEDEEE